MAVYGEFNKNSANPINKLFEVIQDTAFQKHTYKHTTMGFLRDVRAMPDEIDYSRTFFHRFYEPEYVTILVVGDVKPEHVQELVQRYWGDWKRGKYVADIPAEPPQQAPLECHVDWPDPTQPWVVVAYKTPAFSTQQNDMAALDVLSALAFSPSSKLYQELYVKDRKVDTLFGYFPDHVDPFLGMIMARVKDPADWALVRDRILDTCEHFKTTLVDDKRLEAVKSNLRYSFADDLDSSAAIAEALTSYIARTRTPESVNRVYGMYAKLTPEDIRRVARKYLVPTGRTIATLSHGALPEAPPAAGEVKIDTAAALPGVAMHTSSPLVSFRLLFRCGAADDPKGKRGLANVTAQMLTAAASKQHTYAQILDELYPMAAGVSAQVDEEMTVFSGTVHRDHLDDYWALLREMLTQPAFDAEDFARIRANAITGLDVGLRRSDDEETGKEVLLGAIFHDHPYDAPPAGAIEDLRNLTLDDVRAFYRAHLRADDLRVGLAGDFPTGFEQRVQRELREALATADATPAEASADGHAIGKPIPPAPEIGHNRMRIVEKSTRATGLHIGFPLDVKRGDPDWVALWLVRSYFGEHRSENSFLYQRLREIRGLNYGDYCYIEYFPNGGEHFRPEPNVARSRQVFQVWLRPVPPENGPFALKAAWWELDKLVKNGLTEKQFEATRDYLSKSVAMLVQTDDRRLGYALDSMFYGTPEFVRYVRDGLAKLTLDDVNRAIKTHLRSDRLQFVVVTADAKGFRDAILGDAPTPITYQAKPGPDILAEDAIIEKLHLDLRPDDVTIEPIDDVFEH